MAQIVNIQPLRAYGVRTVDLPYALGGHFRVRSLGGHTELTLVGRNSDKVILGPLLDPRLVAAEPEGFVLAGTEDVAGSTLLQEWLVIVARPDPAPPEYPVY